MKRTVLTATALLLFVSSALADGFIVVPPHPPRQPTVRTVPLAVKSHHVKVTIENQVAVTKIDQVFVNPNPYQLEGTYIFPLPENASISAFSMFVDGKKIDAELLEKDKARKIYEGIVRRMRDPALLEYAGRDLFRASIFPIPAGGEKRIQISYQEVCPAEGGMLRYRYPLNTEKFSSRPLEHVSVVVDVKGKLPIGNITCPTHPVEIVRKGRKEAIVTYEAKHVVPDRDFVLYASLSDKEFALNFLARKEKDGEKGWFLLLVSPNLTDGKPIPKDVCFVLDTSGSMAGKKIEQAKAALKFCLRSLNPADRFDLLPFSSDVRPFADDLESATPKNVEKALSFVEGIKALGGTAIDAALTKAMSMAPKSDRPYMIVFITDGLPTVGETRTPKILKHVRAHNSENVRLFAFGVGNDVNTHLLDELAAENHGSRDYVSESESLEVAVSNFFSKVSNPALSNVSLKFTGAKVSEVFPHTLPDLFMGTQLAVVGRYEGSGAGAVTLSGTVNGKKERITHDLTFPALSDRADYLPRLWAIRKIGYLLDAIRLNGQKKELVDEIVRLAKKYGVVTPYTSYLVQRDRSVTAESSSGWAPRPGAPAASAGGPAPDAGGGAFRSGKPSARKNAANGLSHATGKAAVAASKEASKLQGASPDSKKGGLVPDAGREQAKQDMRIVKGTTFYRQKDVWVQADLPKDAKRVKLASMSDELFAFLRKHPKAASFVALGKVDFVLDGVVYQVR